MNDFYAREFWRFVLVQQRVTGLAMTAIKYPPMQDPASFNLDAIKKKKGVVEYVIFDNEGHGFTKKENEMRASKATLDFLDKYLKGATKP